jgi:hypothetical protein
MGGWGDRPGCAPGFLRGRDLRGGLVRSAGRVPSTPEGLGLLAESLLASDRWRWRSRVRVGRSRDGLLDSPLPEDVVPLDLRPPRSLRPRRLATAMAKGGCELGLSREEDRFEVPEVWVDDTDLRRDHDVLFVDRGLRVVALDESARGEHVP